MVLEQYKESPFDRFLAEELYHSQVGHGHETIHIWRAVKLTLSAGSHIKVSDSTRIRNNGGHYRPPDLQV